MIVINLCFCASLNTTQLSHDNMLA
jgi:hypothetical protein